MTDENWNGYNFGNWDYNYADTKKEGEKRVRQYADEGLEIVVIYPGAMMGAFDFTLQYGRLFFDLRDGKVPAVPAGGNSFANVRNVAIAHMNAATMGRPNEGYVCAGDNITYRDLFETIANKFDKHAPRFDIPPSFLTAYGYLEEFIANFTNKPPQLNPGMARYMSITASYDSSKARNELDYKVSKMQDIVDAAYEWYLENGIL
jgi:dihydroflavonol-4-reductase